MKKKTWANKLLNPAGISINGKNPQDIQVHNEAFYNRVLTQGSVGLGESYMDGWWSSASLDQFFCRLLGQDIQNHFTLSLPFVWQLIKANLFNLQATSKAFEVAHKHYDLGNDFFAPMLGKSMVYSCAYFKDTDNLDDAQYAKLDLVCRKLHLQKGQRILDIGSGWGTFAKFAAERYGVSVVGITVSREQKTFAEDLCRGLPVEFRLQDYRTLNEKFDHIVSIGMFEHVGLKNYRTYMQVARRCLKENGLFLLHTIGWPITSRAMDPWINKYIFPNGKIPSLKQITQSAENVFVVEDIHNFGADYDKTLMAWHKNFQEHWPAVAKSYDEKFHKMWQYYLLSCAGGFRARKIQLWQIVLSPNGVLGGYQSER